MRHSQTSAIAQKLLMRFGSIQGIREAAREAVVAEVGEKKSEVPLQGLEATMTTQAD